MWEGVEGDGGAHLGVWTKESRSEPVARQTGRKGQVVSHHLLFLSERKLTPNRLPSRRLSIRSLKHRYESSLVTAANGLLASLNDLNLSSSNPPSASASQAGGSLHDDSRILRDFDDSIETGFQIATFQGPLCAEPVVGMAYFVEKVEIDSSEDRETRTFS
jgi:translation elongation factor EF-G